MNLIHQRDELGCGRAGGRVGRHGDIEDEVEILWLDRRPEALKPRHHACVLAPDVAAETPDIERFCDDSEGRKEKLAEATPLHSVEDGQGELCDVRIGLEANPPTDAETGCIGSAQVQGTPRDVIDAIGGREVLELGLAQGRDRSEEAETSGGFGEMLESIQQPLPVGRHNGPQCDRRAIAEAKLEEGR